MLSFEEDLAKAIEYHGHLCSGQITGVRMARFACKLLQIDSPKQYRNLIVYVESDRCITDAIGTVTGCKLGKRTLKWLDFGKTAATFVDLASNNAIRIYRKSKRYPAANEDLVTFFQKIPDEEMFHVQKVSVEIPKGDLPGKPIEVQACECCGEEVLDQKHMIQEGKILCKSCGGQGYYS